MAGKAIDNQDRQIQTVEIITAIRPMSTVPRNTGVMPNALITKNDLSAHESANLHD